ncbi:MAG: hypothetical protein ACP5NF_04740 [Thermoanaerobaculum sp.]
MASTRESWDGQLSLFEDPALREAPKGRPVLVFDLETQKSFEEVAGRNTRQLGISVGVVYSFADDQFHVFFENEVDRLIATLAAAELVVGFNVLGFDYEVLRGYGEFPGGTPPTLDIMLDLQQKLSFRPKLDSVVQATLGEGKSADGLAALRWYREGRLDEIAKYCQEDVRLTRDLYLYGKRHRHVLVARYSGSPVKVDVDW